MSNYSQVWNLDRIFEGGSESSSLSTTITELTEAMLQLKLEIGSLQLPISSDWSRVISELQRWGSVYSEISSFISCLVSQNVKDKNAKILLGSITQIGADYDALKSRFERKIAEIPADEWALLQEDPELTLILFALDEMRQSVLDKLSLEQEELIGDLSIDGYHGWWEMYNSIVGKMHVSVEEEGAAKQLSMGQLSNKLFHPDRAVRLAMFDLWEEAWKNQADMCAVTLNHIAGYRLQVYKHRRWESVLKEPLNQNRMRQETLDTMWRVITKAKERLVPYMDRKAKLLGLEKLSWVDIQAPLPGHTRTISYDEGADFIVEQFYKFNPDMAVFAKKAFTEQWIEAEDRSGKRPGGFMTSLPVSGESRIFMTYSGTPRCISTLAHELGHAYHTYVMKDLPLFSQQYAMNVAETASTFAEMIVGDAAIRMATSKEEKIPLLADKIEGAISFFMDIHSRFIFESRMYEARKSGHLSTDQLCQMMVEAQKEGFSNQLEGYDPYFWASKLHFYGTDVPFYNFPYSFGYLFSAGIYAQARTEGAGFTRKYVDLLRDTASMKVEELASRHLGVDLTKEDFWQSAVDVALEDVGEFLALTIE